MRQDQSSITYLAKIQQDYNLLTVEAFKLRKNLKETQEELMDTVGVLVGGAVAVGVQVLLNLLNWFREIGGLIILTMTSL